MRSKDFWTNLQQSQLAFTPSWALLNPEALDPDDSYQPLSLHWRDGLLVAAPGEIEYAAYVARVSLFVTADDDGLPTFGATEEVTIVPVIDATGIVLVTNKRILGRLTDGYFVKIPLNPEREAVFRLSRDKIIWTECDADLNWRGRRRTILCARGPASFGAVCVSPTHLLNRYAADQKDRFVPVSPHHLPEALEFEIARGNRVKSHSGVSRGLAHDDRNYPEIFARRIRELFEQPWLSHP